MTEAEIFYFSLQDEQTREEKLNWFDLTSFYEIPFERVTPDKKHNWINLTDNDFDELLPLIDKNVKAGKEGQAIFKLFSAGVKTQRDEWVYDFSREALTKKVKYMIDAYMTRLETGDRLELDMKWDAETESYIQRKIHKEFDKESIKEGMCRPFCKQFFYFDRHFNGRTYKIFDIFPSSINQNWILAITNHTQIPFLVQSLDCIPSLDVGGRPTQCLPLYRYDKNGDRHDNITDWGLHEIQQRSGDTQLTKLDIFHYVYAVLHHPAYRQKYEIDLKRDFPRLPIYPNIRQWVAWGRDLMELHIHFETVAPYGLHRSDQPSDRPDDRPDPKPKLKADKSQGQIILDSETTLSGVPAIAWDYKLGNRSAIEWVLDQHKEKTPKDPTIRELFNTYRFSDHKEKVIDLCDRLCTVSVRTVEIMQQMPPMPPPNPPRQ
jgi:predicted helicase